MSIPYRYICRKDNPQAILMAGYCHFENQYDPDFYEEIEASLPANAYLLTPETKNRLFIQFLKDQTLTVRSQLYPLLSGVFYALGEDDLEVAQEILTSLEFPVELEPLKNQLLNILA